MKFLCSAVEITSFNDLITTEISGRCVDSRVQRMFCVCACVLQNVRVELDRPWPHQNRNKSPLNLRRQSGSPQSFVVWSGSGSHAADVSYPFCHSFSFKFHFGLLPFVSSLLPTHCLCLCLPSSFPCVLMHQSKTVCVHALQSLTPEGGVPGAPGRTAPPLVGVAHAVGTGSATRRPPGTVPVSAR
jgi:hypothetical protein